MVFHFLLRALYALRLELAVDLFESVSKDEYHVNQSKANDNANVKQSNLAASLRLVHKVAKQHEHVKDDHVGAFVEGLHPGGKVRVERPCPVDHDD